MRLSLAAANRAAITLLAVAVRGMLQHNAGLTGAAAQSVRREPSRSRITVVARTAQSSSPMSANFGSKNVSAYAIDATSGALTPLAG